MKKLLQSVPSIGRIEWIGRSPERRAAIEVLDSVEIVAGQGVAGDHHASNGGKRQVSLIQAEHLGVMAQLLPDGGAGAGQRDSAGSAVVAASAAPGSATASPVALIPITPERCRRNLVVSGLNLLALKELRFTIGDPATGVILQGSGPCPPCSRMEEELGVGGYQAMRGHGGITAEVIRGGVIRVGDEVRAEPVAEE